MAEQNIWEKSIIYLSFKNNQSLVLISSEIEQQQKRRSMTYPSFFSEPQKSFSLVFDQHELSLVKPKEVFSFFFSVCIPFLFFLLPVTRGIVCSGKGNHNVLWKPLQSLVIFWPIHGVGNCAPLEGSDDDVRSDAVPGSTHPAEDILYGGLPETARSCQRTSSLIQVTQVSRTASLKCFAMLTSTGWASVVQPPGMYTTSTLRSGRASLTSWVRWAG